MKERPILFNAEMVRAVLDGTKSQTRRVVKYNSDLWGRCRDLNIKQAGIDPADWRVSGHVSGQLCVGVAIRCPYGVPGDRLWVREAFQMSESFTEPDHEAVCYRADGAVWTYWDGFDLKSHELLEAMDFKLDSEETGSCRPNKWRPSIHMPRWASRILLEVTEVRVERVQDISELDAEQEGVFFDRIVEEDTGESWHGPTGPLVRERHGPPGMDLRPSAEEAFADLWDSINAKRGFGWEANPWVWVVGFKRVTP